MSARSEVAVHPDLDPAEFQHQTHALAKWFAELAVHVKNKIVAGFVTDPTTPSAQLTGTGNTTWSYDMTTLLGIVNGAVGEIAAATDGTIHSGSFLTGLVDGASCVAALVLENNAGTFALTVVKGTPATTGSQKAPTDAEIQTAVGASVPWVKVAECTINRTGDTTVTESQNNNVRPILGVTVGGTDFGAFTG
jgi:hypothetical protein